MPCLFEVLFCDLCKRFTLFSTQRCANAGVASFGTLLVITNDESSISIFVGCDRFSELSF